MILGKSYLGATEASKLYLGSDLVYPTTPAATYLLDTYTNATSGISFRKLKTGVVNCCEIRRSSDDALAVVILEDSGQISLSSSIVAGGTLGTWITANSPTDDGYLRTMYDQSGSGNDFTQTTNAFQWQLILSGVLNTDSGGNVSAPTTNLQKGMGYSGLSYSGISTVFSVLETSDTLGVLYVHDANTIAATLESGSTNVTDINAGTCSYYGNGALLTPTERGALYTSWSTGTPVLTTSYIGDTSGFTNFQFSGYPAGGFSLDCNFSELIQFSSDENTNQSAIELEINTAYTIY